MRWVAGGSSKARVLVFLNTDNFYVTVDWGWVCLCAWGRRREILRPMNRPLDDVKGGKAKTHRSTPAGATCISPLSCAWQEAGLVPGVEIAEPGTNCELARSDSKV